MNKKRGIVSILILSMAVMMLSGCARKFDASGYTKAVLDVCYKGETEQYMKLTNSSKEEAEAVFSDNMEQIMEEFAALNLSEELQASYKEFFEDLAKNVKYTVGEAVPDKKGNFMVDVSVEPITNLQDTYEEFMTQTEEYTTQLSNDIINGGETPTEEEMQNKVFEIYYNILRDSIDAGINYGEAQTVTMHVNKGNNNVYEIPEADLTALDELTIAADIF